MPLVSIAGKAGTGVLPVVGESPDELGGAESDRVFAVRGLGAAAGAAAAQSQRLFFLRLGCSPSAAGWSAAGADGPPVLVDTKPG